MRPELQQFMPRITQVVTPLFKLFEDSGLDIRYEHKNIKMMS